MSHADLCQQVRDLQWKHGVAIAVLTENGMLPLYEEQLCAEEDLVDDEIDEDDDEEC